MAALTVVLSVHAVIALASFSELYATAPTWVGWRRKRTRKDFCSLDVFFHNRTEIIKTELKKADATKLSILYKS